MKSKNIPHDIKVKSIQEAQNEVKQILQKLEDSDVNLEESLEDYNRMINLNNHIKECFKKKANEIKLLIKKKNKFF